MIGRRAFLAAAAAAAACPAPSLADTGDDGFVAEARRLAGLPHRDTAMPLPAPFDALTYDSYRGIRPAPGGASGIELGGGMIADLLPPGFYFRDAVRVEIETEQGWHELGYDPALFDYDPRYFDGVPAIGADARERMGFSGVRLRAPFRTAAAADEFLVVQGASYFRAVSRDTLYGLSARALALGTGEAGPEEFPVFTRLRLFRSDGATVRIAALMESPSLTGAVEMRVRPGEPTVTEIETVLFPRTDLDASGIAPLTSMYLKGPLRASVSDDFRPAVHDSDALLIRNGADETLWRPLSNPAALQISAFADDAPRGFGLVQSRRRFDDFEDAEALYHRRPTAWVEPAGDWGPGAVTLVEIPTGDEFLDNMVAFWRPAAPLRAGAEHRFAYRVRWGAAPAEVRPDLAAISQTRSGRVHDRPGRLQYVVDFSAPGGGALTPDLSASAGTVEGMSAYWLPGRGDLRVGFVFAPGDAPSAELRLVLRDAAGQARSQVWLHRWTPARDGGP